MLELQGLRKSYGDFTAVDGVDLVVPKGAIYGFLGPNGAGKTTTIRMIMNIYTPDAGGILFDGRPLSRESTDRIGYLPEERGLYRKMKILDHLVYLARLKGVDSGEAAARAQRWLDRLELGDRANAKVDELSKGMQQKVQFIGTVISDLQMIILDEPFSGLDPINVKLLREIILEMRQQGRTLLFSTHMLEQAEQMCDHIFLIHKGKKVLDGPLDMIRENYPVDTIVIRSDIEAGRIESLPMVQSAELAGNEVRVRLNDGHDHQALLAQLVPMGRVDHFAAAKPPLSDIFIREVEGIGGTVNRDALLAGGATNVR